MRVSSGPDTSRHPKATGPRIPKFLGPATYTPIGNAIAALRVLCERNDVVCEKAFDRVLHETNDDTAKYRSRLER